MNDSRPYITRRQAVRTLGLVTVSTLFGASLAPDEAEAAKYYKIIYKLNGGVNPNKQKKKLRSGKSKKVSKLKKPTRAGYTFAGWYTDKKLTKKAKKVYGKKKKAKRRIYAKWTPTDYAIAYKLNGGKAPIALPASHNIESPAMNLVGAQRDDYSFGGWFSNSALTSRVNAIAAKTTGKKTLYAKWNDTKALWDAHLEEKCTAANELREKLEATSGSKHVDQFIFITDTHLHSSAMRSPQLVQQVSEKTGIKRVVFGGDCIGLSASTTEARAILRYTASSLRPAGGELLFCRGNHDMNDQGSTAAALADAAYAADTGVAAEAAAGGKFCFVHDVEDKHIRYIVLDTDHPGSNEYKTTDKQAAWFKARLSDCPEGWTIVVIQHQFFQTLESGETPASPRLDPNGKATVQLLNGAYAKDGDEKLPNGAVIAGVLCGHGHYDHAERPSLERSSATYRKGHPYQAIATTCDAVDKPSSHDPAHTQRVRGTLGEHAFDIVTIDTKARRFYLTRIGAGSDRGGDEAPLGYGSASESGA